MASYREPVAVIGLGRFGAALAAELVRLGTEVLAVDRSEEVVQRFATTLGRVVAADATSLDALTEIGVGDFTRAVIAIGDDQESSILATSLVSDLGIGQIWAKALSAQHAKILTRVGAHHVVLPEHDMGERVAHLVAGTMIDYMEVDPGWVIARARPPQHIVGRPLAESRLRSERRVTVVAFKGQGEAGFRHAEAETVLGYGDEILVMGPALDVERFVESH